MFHLAGHHDLGDSFALQDLDQLAQFADGNPMASPGQRFHLHGGFLAQSDRHHLVAQAARLFERQNRKPAVAGDESVDHRTGCWMLDVGCWMLVKTRLSRISNQHPTSYFTNPRFPVRMNSISSSSSGEDGTSARMRSMACAVFSPARVNRRKVVCNCSISSVEKPR